MLNESMLDRVRLKSERVCVREYYSRKRSQLVPRAIVVTVTNIRDNALNAQIGRLQSKLQNKSTKEKNT